jgi:hypothetical protein
LWSWLTVAVPVACGCSFEKVEAMRAEIRRKELLEKKLAGEVEEEELEGQLAGEEAKIDETEEAGGCSEWQRTVLRS